MKRIVIEFTTGYCETFERGVADHTGWVDVEFVGGFVVVSSSDGKTTAFPAHAVKKVETYYPATIGPE